MRIDSRMDSKYYVIASHNGLVSLAVHCTVISRRFNRTILLSIYETFYNQFSKSYNVDALNLFDELPDLKTIETKRTFQLKTITARSVAFVIIYLHKTLLRRDKMTFG